MLAYAGRIRRGALGSQSRGKTGDAAGGIFRAAVGEKARAVVRAEIARGKSIPPDIAATMDETRGAFTPLHSDAAGHAGTAPASH
jgi:hypothetical protein